MRVPGYIYVIGAFLLLFLTCAASSKKMPNTTAITVTDEDNNGRVQLAKSDSLIVRLASQPSTGYGWKIVQNDTSRLRFQGEAWESPDTEGLMGTREYQAFRFIAQKADSSVVKFHYVRPWEKDAPPAKTYLIKVQKP